MDTGTRKFGIAALVAGSLVGAEQYTLAVVVFCVYTAANVILKFFGKEAEAAE